MNCSAIPNTNANSSGRGTWVLLVRPTSSGTSETTKPSAATSAPSRLLLATWYAAVASKASRRSQLSQCTAIAQSMQVACPVGDEPAHPIGLQEIAWKAQAELRRQRGNPSRAVHASTYPMTQETPHRQCHRSAARQR